MINNYTLTCSLSLQHRVLPLMHYGKLCINYYAMVIYSVIYFIAW